MHFVQTLFVLSTICSTQGQVAYLLGGSPVLPGLQARFTRQFFDLLNDVGSNVIDDVLGGSRPLKFKKIEKKVPGGNIKIKDLQIDHYKNNAPYILEMSAPYSIKVGIQDADVTVNSKYEFTPGLGSIGTDIVDRFIGAGTIDSVLEGKVKPATGRARVTARGLSVLTTSTVDKREDGRVSIEVTKCETKFKDFTVVANPDEGSLIPPGFGGDVRDKILSQSTRPIFEQEICVEIKNIIDHSLNDQLSEWGYKIKLSKLDNIFKSNEKARDSADDQAMLKEEMQDMIYNQVKDFELDMGLIERPLLLGVKPYDFLDSKHKGEISYKGMGGTPFYPHAMVPPILFDKMVICSASDYILNSFLYGMYKQRKAGLIKSVISPETMPSQAKRLRTTCEDVFCVGDFFEEIGKKHPNKDVEILLDPIDQPYFIIHPGSIKGEITEKITMKVYKSGSDKSDVETVLEGTLTMKPEARIVVQDDKLHGKIELKELKMPLTQDGQTSNEFAEVLKLLMEDELNNRLQAGVTLPKIHAAKLKNIQLDFLWRTIKIKADVEVDREKLTDMVSDAIRDAVGPETPTITWRGSPTR